MNAEQSAIIISWPSLLYADFFNLTRLGATCTRDNDTFSQICALYACIEAKWSPCSVLTKYKTIHIFIAKRPKIEKSFNDDFLKTFEFSQ